MFSYLLSLSNHIFLQGEYVTFFFFHLFLYILHIDMSSFSYSFQDYKCCVSDYIIHSLIYTQLVDWQFVLYYQFHAVSKMKTYIPKQVN